MNAIRIIRVLFAATAAVATLSAATVEDMNARSEKMGRGIPVTVIKPEVYSQSADARFPVAYALHGSGGNNVSFAGTDRALADRWQVVVVCPDGGLTSWWLDSPIDPAYQYETFVAKELVGFMDQRYRTLATREKRAIVGGSMGGHGACYIGFRNKSVFGAVGKIFGRATSRPRARMMCPSRTRPSGSCSGFSTTISKPAKVGCRCAFGMREPVLKMQE
jgi:S-formylglutathione hydrolase FrmB